MPIPLSVVSSDSSSFSLSSTLSSESLEWASLREKLNQAKAGIEMTGILNGSFSQSYSGESGNYNNSHSDSISATLSKSLYDGGVSDAQKSISQLNIDQKSLQIKILEQSVILEIVSIHLNTLVANFTRKLREKKLRQKRTNIIPTPRSTTSKPRCKARRRPARR